LAVIFYSKNHQLLRAASSLVTKIGLKTLNIAIHWNLFVFCWNQTCGRQNPLFQYPTVFKNDNSSGRSAIYLYTPRNLLEVDRENIYSMISWQPYLFPVCACWVFWKLKIVMMAAIGGKSFESYDEGVKFIRWNAAAGRQSSSSHSPDGPLRRPMTPTRRKFLTYHYQAMQCIQCDGSASMSELSNQESAKKRQQRVGENSEALHTTVLHTTVEAASSLFNAFTVIIVPCNWQWWCSCALFWCYLVVIIFLVSTYFISIYDFILNINVIDYELWY